MRILTPGKGSPFAASVTFPRSVNSCAILPKEDNSRRNRKTKCGFVCLCDFMIVNSFFQFYAAVYGGKVEKVERGKDETLGGELRNNYYL